MNKDSEVILRTTVHDYIEDDEEFDRKLEEKKGNYYIDDDEEVDRRKNLGDYYIDEDRAKNLMKQESGQKNQSEKKKSNYNDEGEAEVDENDEKEETKSQQDYGEEGEGTSDSGEDEKKKTIRFEEDQTVLSESSAPTKASSNLPIKHSPKLKEKGRNFTTSFYLEEPLASLPQGSIETTRNWNEEFQAAYEALIQFQAQDRPGIKSYYNKLFVQKQLKLAGQARQVYDDMLEIAIPAAKKIIEGKLKGVHYIPPIDIGGRAGGTKFLYKGIFFKLASDEFGLYKNQSNANKSVSHEMRGLMAFIKCAAGGIKDFNLPMAFVVDYLGYKLYACAQLPINKKTLVFGSQDGGKTVISTDPQMHKTMIRAAKLLKLKEHKVGDHIIPFPFDIEGHRGLDNRLYVVDFARVFPPTWGKKGSYLYELMRPEFVANYPIPLSPDGLTRRFKTPEDEKEIEDATQYLWNTIIPEVTKKLEQTFSSSKPVLLCRAIHSYGINIRYLARIYSYATSAQLKELIFGEMLARSIKILCKEEMRCMTNPNEENLKNFSVEFLNKVFDVTHSKHNKFWVDDIIPLLESKFSCKVPSHDLLQLRNRFSFIYVLNRVTQMTGIILKDNSKIPVSLEDFIEVKELVVHPGIYLFSKALYEYKKGSKNRAIECLNLALDKEPTDELLNKYLSMLEDPNVRFSVSSPATEAPDRLIGTTEHTNIELEGMVEWKRTQNTWRKVWCSLFKDREFTFYPDYNKSQILLQSKIREVKAVEGILEIKLSHKTVFMTAEDISVWEGSMNQVLFNFFSAKYKSYFMGGERLNICPMTYCSNSGYVCGILTYFGCCCWAFLGCLYCVAGGKYNITDKGCGINVCCPRQRWWYETVVSRSYLDLKTPEKIKIIEQNQRSELIKRSFQQSENREISKNPSNSSDCVGGHSRNASYIIELV